MAELPPLRRIVAGHNEQGIGCVTSDGAVASESLGLEGNSVKGRIWTTFDGLPTNDNNIDSEGFSKPIEKNFGLHPDVGTNLQYTEIEPGFVSPMHRTSSLDYNIWVEGEAILIMEDGSETVINRPGDVVIMRGALHAWKNPSTTKWCRWVTVLASAKPVVLQGKELEPRM
ncbi:hypothetical protein K435DRAFT_772575 [Dendrothele bispora CBS 962.96]|uniref:Cupin 2 conserved barrel domain-containing protein n=1 Tax=Dendrothele bispora (strain CBS 962.96) TaxID=1314807 RepID=A0A4S8MX27_DENBC|nr:hypothetical protein K435DRAFT_772575 [Dendrothele bispora CBS 962.96]